MKKRLFGLCCAVFLALCACLPASAEREIPQCLHFRQKMTTTKMRNNRNSFVTVPETALPEVDREIAEAVNRLYAAAEPFLAEKGAIASCQDRIALSVSSLQLWVDEQIAIGKMKPPEEEQ